MRLHHWPRRTRQGMAALEVVFTTGIAILIAVPLLKLVIWVVRVIFGMLGSGVGMPYL